MPANLFGSPELLLVRVAGGIVGWPPKGLLVFLGLVFWVVEPTLLLCLGMGLWIAFAMEDCVLGLFLFWDEFLSILDYNCAWYWIFTNSDILYSLITIYLLILKYNY